MANGGATATYYTKCDQWASANCTLGQYICSVANGDRVALATTEVNHAIGNHPPARRNSAEWRTGKVGSKRRYRNERGNGQGCHRLAKPAVDARPEGRVGKGVDLGG